ncbi:MAG: SAM-dependent methyltransferase [Proteobacteria bacterium]|nr:SAM-dependent methyltransferase [Pseudomonadota bacterium]
MTTTKLKTFWISLLFVGSGCAALIYEVVWFQLLRLTIGSSSLSVGITVATFMGGMCIGSWGFHRYIKDKRHPLQLFLALESGIALCAILNLFVIPGIAGLYFDVAGYGAGGIAVRGIVAAIFLLPPTIMMGATLPAVARWVSGSPTGAVSLGFFYSANIFGAVLGTLVAGFVLLRLFDTRVATGVGVFLNLLVSGTAWYLSRRDTSYRPTKQIAAAVGNTKFYWVVALSGFAALAAQIIWTRQLALFFGGTVYSFSIILATFLVGLGVGSVVCTRLLDSGKWAAEQLLLLCQIGLVPAIWWASFTGAHLIHLIDPLGANIMDYEDTPSWALKSISDLIRAFCILFPATFLWGATFPAALASTAEKDRQPDRYFGGLYAANTAGAVLGALLVTIVVIPTLGTAFANNLAMQVSLAAVVLLCVTARDAVGEKKWLLIAPLFFVAIVPVQPNDQIQLLGRLQYNWHDVQTEQIEEGMNSTVGISSGVFRGGVNYQIHEIGKVVASSLHKHMRIQRHLGHMHALFHPEPKSVLIIGFGAGVTAGTFTLYDSIERIVIVEIEPRVPMLSGRYLARENYDVLEDPRTELIIDDGRHFLATSDERFDIITTDPIHPYIKGAASLYTSEFYELVLDRLNPGGIATQWIPFYETDEAAVKSQVASFVASFPRTSVWNSQPQGVGYDVTLMGHTAPLAVTPFELETKFHRQRIVESYAEVGLSSIDQVIELYSGHDGDISWWLEGAQINRDHNLRLEYLAGTALDGKNATEILTNMNSRTSRQALEQSIQELFGL